MRSTATDAASARPSSAPLCVALADARLMVHEVVPEPAHDAEGAAVRHVLDVLDHVRHVPVGRHVEGEGAAEAAVGARGEMALHLPQPCLHGAQVLGEGPHGADREALAAGDAVFRVCGRHPGVYAGPHEVEHVAARYLPARADAAQAEDAAVFEVLDQGRCVALDPFLSRHRIVGLLDGVLEDQVLEVAFPARVADGAVEGMIGEDQLQIIPPHRGKLRRLRGDDHAFLHGGGA